MKRIVLVFWLVFGATGNLWSMPSGQGDSGAQSKDVEDLKQRVSELEALVKQLQRQVQGAAALKTAKTSAVAMEKVTTEAPPTVPNQLNVYWKEGLRLDSADKKFQFKLGGRIQHDWGFFSGDRSLESRVGPLLDGVEFRRTRIEVSGKIYGHFFYKGEYDFAGVDSHVRDVYVGLEDLPVLGSIQVGHMKEPFGLEEITSSKHITFLERSSGSIFNPVRNTGAMIRNAGADERVVWAAGVFRDSDETGLALADGGYHFTARLTGLPWYRDGGRQLLHLGVAYSRQNPLSGTIRYRQRPEAHLAPRFVDTGNIPADSLDLLGLEAALVQGPFSLQSEYQQSSVHSAAPQDPTFTAYYIQGSFFVTGEHRRYKGSDGAFDRVLPRSIFLEEGGHGAWEIAARFSHLNLEDRPIQGGRLDNFTLGLNWYLNSNARVMWNYIFSDRERDGDANLFQTRFQVDF